MTNKELQEKFDILTHTENVFDRYFLIEGLQLEYRKSDFYKKTKMPFNEAADLYRKERGNVLGVVDLMSAVDFNQMGGNFNALNTLKELSAEDREFLKGLVGVEFGEEGETKNE